MTHIHLSVRCGYLVGPMITASSFEGSSRFILIFKGFSYRTCRALSDVHRRPQALLHKKTFIGSFPHRPVRSIIVLYFCTRGLHLAAGKDFAQSHTDKRVQIRTRFFIFPIFHWRTRRKKSFLEENFIPMHHVYQNFSRAYKNPVGGGL